MKKWTDVKFLYIGFAVAQNVIMLMVMAAAENICSHLQFTTVDFESKMWLTSTSNL